MSENLKITKEGEIKLLTIVLEKVCKAFRETMELEYGSKVEIQEVDEAEQLIKEIKERRGVK